MKTDIYKIVYLTPSLHIAGGVERVLTLKANYFAEQFGYDITLILTDGKGQPFPYPLSDKIKVINLDIRFEELWSYSFLKKIFVYLQKQRRFRKMLKAELMRLRPDITISLLRREINFLNTIKDGSLKLGELHVNRQNYRNFEANDTNFVKRLFERYWMKSLVTHLKQLDQFVVLTHEDCKAWHELSNVKVIPDPLSFVPSCKSALTTKRVIAVGRYTYQKGFDLLLQAWAKVEQACPEWELAIYGAGNNVAYQEQARQLGVDMSRCHVCSKTSDIQKEYVNSSLFVLSSRFEGFGMVLVEAMACGLPVVSFDCPCGPKDIIRDGVDGYLVPLGNVDELANRLIALMNSPEEMRRMAQNAIERSGDYDMQAIAEQWRELFNSLKSKTE